MNQGVIAAEKLAYKLLTSGKTSIKQSNYSCNMLQGS